MRGHPKQVCDAFFGLPNEQKMKRLLNRDDNAWLSRLQDGGRCLLKYTEADAGAEVYALYSAFITFLQIFQSDQRLSGGLSTISELPALLFIAAPSYIPTFTEYSHMVLQLYGYRIGSPMLSLEHAMSV